MTTRTQDLAALPEPYLSFWRERHLCTLTTLRPDGSPHVVPVGVTYDAEAGLARVITNGSSRKVRNVLAAGPEGARVAVCQTAGRRWATLEGRARVRTEPERVAGVDGPIDRCRNSRTIMSTIQIGLFCPPR